MSEFYSLPPYQIDGPQLSRGQLSELIDWGLREHEIPDLWQTTKGEGVLVGIVDSGVPSHSDLPEPVFRHNYTRDATAQDFNGHATHVAGIAGARANTRGVVGVAPRCDIGYCKGLTNRGFGDSAGLAAAIRKCVAEGCRIINLSFGGRFSQTIEDAISEAVDQNVICVAAAGNTGYGGTIHPGDSSLTVGVAAYNRHGEIAAFSSRGPAVDLACPGEQILSTWLDDGYRSLSGTSMAAPFLCGVLALAMSAGVEIDARDVRQFLKPATVDRGELGHDHHWGWGVLDVKSLLNPPELEIGPYKISYETAGSAIKLTIDHRSG